MANIVKIVPKTITPAVVKISGLVGPTGTTGAQGIQGIKGDRGDTGATGSQGIQGIQGTAGASVTIKGSYANLATFNAGAGASPGTIGDSWILLSDGSLMTYASAGWFDAGDIQGPQGIQGIQGIQGVPGNDAAIPTEITFSVNGGTTGIQPTFDGAPMFYGSYIKNGAFVNFRINVSMTNITRFGSGQYFVDLPFTSKYEYLMRNGCIHDGSSGKQYSISGHVAANSSRLFLFYTASNGQDDQFTQSSPIGLDTADSFHIAGNFISI